MVVAYIGLGSNIGDRKKNILKAVKLILKNSHFKVLEKSSLYLTKPIGPKQRKFVNYVLKVNTDLSPLKLLKTLKDIEAILGRKKTQRWGPRIIDLDILFCGNKVLKAKNLNVPHKEIQNRSFVLDPLAEIAPRLVHPVLKETVTELKNKLIRVR
ncbi:MAG: 2-amino-4-hydroxy-6-hydroxymethyldihydropteridine diphosphokinase [Elusimicrobia bacterium]|nr:2-amino-4-hydroxy-6-hydroxymethyldihydropteridine diphosphokinase [Elusimicrobiota bacterium]